MSKNFIFSKLQTPCRIDCVYQERISSQKVSTWFNKKTSDLAAQGILLTILNTQSEIFMPQKIIFSKWQTPHRIDGYPVKKDPVKNVGKKVSTWFIKHFWSGNTREFRFRFSKTEPRCFCPSNFIFSKWNAPRRIDCVNPEWILKQKV